MSGAPNLAQQQAHARATALLSSHMIDPREVLTRDLTTEGYLTFAYDIGGNRVWNPKSPDYFATIEHTWPVGFPVADFLAAVREWQGAQL